jgi:hypothetical protein
MGSKSSDGLDIYVPCRKPPSEIGKRKCYAPPLLRTLRSEQAALFLVGYAYVGHQGARAILEILFPAPVKTKAPTPPVSL